MVGTVACYLAKRDLRRFLGTKIFEERTILSGTLDIVQFYERSVTLLGATNCQRGFFFNGSEASDSVVYCFLL